MTERPSIVDSSGTASIVTKREQAKSEYDYENDIVLQLDTSRERCPY